MTTSTSTAIQDLYPEENAHCYGCGRRNPHGHHLKSYVVGDEVVAHFTAPSIYSGGVPGHAYGGLVASLLDCHGTASAAAFQRQLLAAAAGQADVLPRFVTGSLKVDFLKPTPLEQALTLRATLLRAEGRKVWVRLSLAHGDTTCAAGEMLAIQLRS
jgi:acyl-coenzyme A thioesterase PaaI-like protein